MFIKSILVQKKYRDKKKYPKPTSLNRFIASIRGYHQYLYQVVMTPINQAQLLIPLRVNRKIPVTDLKKNTIIFFTIL